MADNYIFNPNPHRVKGLKYTMLVTTCMTADWFLILEKNMQTEELMRHPRLLWILDEVSEKFLKDNYPKTFINITYSLELKDPKEFNKTTAVVFYGKLKNVFEFAKTYAIKEFSLMISKEFYDAEKHKDAFPLNKVSFSAYFHRNMVTEKQKDGYHLETFYPRMMSVVQEQTEKEETEAAEKAYKEAAEKAEIEMRRKAEEKLRWEAEAKELAIKRKAEREKELADSEMKESNK
jgi:hypothetical protein